MGSLLGNTKSTRAADLPVRDLERVLALPRRPPVDCERRAGSYSPAAQALAEHVTARFARSPSPGHACDGRCITVLNPVQAWILREMPKAGGILGFVPVGGGKSLAGMLAPLAVPECRTAVLLAEPSQRHHYRQLYLLLREHFRVPSLVFDDGSSGYVSAGAPVLHFVPYSRLSQPESTDLLEQLRPDLIVADECHRIAARTSSRTRRFLRFMAGADARFCAWSGTLMRKSIRDTAHLSTYALGEGSPLPLDPDEVEAWGNVVDPIGQPDASSSTYDALSAAWGARAAGGAAKVLAGAAKIREGLRRRIEETAGVVTTRATSVECAIYLRERKVPRIPTAVQRALADVRNRWLRPDGEELVEVLEKARVAREVGAGFFYYWAYPRGEDPELIENWFAARKRWNKSLREMLLSNPPAHMDSPLLLRNAAERAWQEPPYEGDLPTWQAKEWPEWAAIQDSVQPDTRAKWIDDFLAADAARWATENRGIVWCQSRTFALRVAQLSDLPYHGGGPNAEAAILAEDGSRSIVASIDAHGFGRDGLQRLFREQYVAEPPASGDAWQQLLGRLCRPGQESDDVTTYVPLHVAENRDALRKALREAEFARDQSGSAQLLLLADWDFDV